MDAGVQNDLGIGQFVGANRIALKNEDPKKLEKAIREIGKLRRRIRTSR